MGLLGHGSPLSVLYSVRIEICVEIDCADVWIMTDGNASSELTLYVGEAVDTCTQQSGKLKKKPIIIGCTSIRHLMNGDDIKRQSHDISTVDQQVRCRSSFRHLGFRLSL